jgi:predicted nucleotidyltransferase
MNNFNLHKEMLLKVARALGPELLEKMAFVGGSTTGLLITDSFTRELIRYTDDVDLIVSVVGYTGWNGFVEQLKPHGFKISMEDEVNCRLRLGELQVDFMPDDADALGFTNIWYKEALACAVPYELEPDTTIKLLTAPYFLATKLEAFKGRGNNDVLSSNDIEDILDLFDGREELFDEIKASSSELKVYLANEISTLLHNSYIDSAVQSTARRDPGRHLLIFERLEAIAGLLN